MTTIFTKSVLIFILSLLFVFAKGNAQNADEAAISKVLSEQVKGWNNGDIQVYMQGYWNSKHLQFIGKNGIRRGYASTLASYQKGYPDTAAMGKLNLDIIEQKKLSATYYFITGKWHLQRTAGDFGGYFTLLFQKIKGRWVIVSDHSS